MKNLPYFILFLLAGMLIGTFLSNPIPDPTGDIVEYYGITESIIRHGSIALTSSDQASLSATLHPEYFSNPGYYLPGFGGQRYPVHFIAYSLLLVPVRVALTYLHLNPLFIFSVGNCLILFACLFYIMRYILTAPWQRIILVVLTFTSPLISFLWWPGPDIFSMCLLLVALCMWYKGKPVSATVITAVASWQSQPIVVISAILCAYLWIKNKRYTPILLAVGVTLIPYIYNMYIFGVPTPWQSLQDGWTRLYGFGMQNVSLLKFFEQFFDLNIGVFWYAPILTVLGVLALRKNIWVAAMLAATLFAYQTNPAWHYGTAGFGPSRHAIVLIPFLISATVWHIRQYKHAIAILIVLTVSQLYILSLNNYIFPIFSNTLYHSSIATFVLDRWPALYNPTPEIFVDRTNHTDLDHPSSAIYMNKGVCKKAYVLITEIDWATQTCGSHGHGLPATILQSDRDGFYINYE
jgi:hypothetical protein